jgi:hypothetical protein
LIQMKSPDIIGSYLEKTIDECIEKGIDDLYPKDFPSWWTRKMTQWFIVLRRKRMDKMADEILKRPPPLPIPQPYVRAVIEEKERSQFFTKPLGHISFSLPTTGLDPLPIHKNGVSLSMFHK